MAAELHQRARTIEERRLRVGLDVGGTNTDAVLMGARRVLAEAKTPTTADVTSGIRRALGDLLGHAGVEPGDVQAVMIGTTHFTNAIIEAKGLSPTAGRHRARPRPGPAGSGPDRAGDRRGGGPDEDGGGAGPGGPRRRRQRTAR